MELMPNEILALKMTQRGKKVLHIKREEMPYQPADMIAAIMAIPSLAARGLMTIEYLNSNGDFLASITKEGNRVLEGQK